MKKLIALGLMAVAAFGAGSAFAAECTGPVSTDCTTEDENGREKFCNLYINTAGAPVEAEVCVEADN